MVAANGGVMTLVAYKNLNPTLGAMKEIRRKQLARIMRQGWRM